MANEYINKVVANNNTLIDLTSDTAEAADVLEGRTLHLASGATATGTYRPSAEIEARLKATVGHSSKNLFDRQFRQGTVANTTTTSAVCSTTIIKTTNGATHRFKCFDNNFSFRVYGLNEAGAQQILSGAGATAANRLFDSDYIFADTYEHTNDNSNIVAYAIMLRKTSTPGQGDWINITPSDVPNDILMVVESPLTIETFEPYVTPTDEKKQDKPVVLWEAALNSTGVSEVAISSLADAVSNYSYLKVVVTNELGTTITDETVVQTDVEYDTSYIGQEVVRSTGGMLGFHTENGSLVFDRLFIWVYSDGTNITVKGLRNHNDSSNPPDVVPGVFIRKIIGIPK